MRQMQNTTNGWLPELFNDIFNVEWAPRTRVATPAMNVLEDATAYQVELAAPGMGKQDFSVQINEDNNLVIKMEKQTENTDTAKPEDNTTTRRYLRREFAYGKFQQTFVLPDDVDKAAIKAKVENGVLTVTLPKLVVKEEPKTCTQIEIG